MLERIAATCRAIASDSRLLILYHLALHDELSVTEIFTRTKMTPDLASIHLKHLASAGLAQRRRSGGRVYYRLPPDGGAAGRFQTAPAIRRAICDPGWATRGWEFRAKSHLAAETVAKVPGPVGRALDVVFDSATAFTDVRRIQIVRLLNQRGQSSALTVVRELGMSPTACWRQMDKLVRRGYVAGKPSTGWRLCARGRTMFHEELLSLVVEALA